MLTRKITESGGSYLVRPPRHLMELVGIKKGDEVSFSVDNGNIIMGRAPNTAGQRESRAQQETSIENAEDLK